MYIYIYPDVLRANPPPRFFKEIANLFEMWTQRHMVKCMRVLRCYMGGVWGGGGAPPRDIARMIW